MTMIRLEIVNNDGDRDSETRALLVNAALISSIELTENYETILTMSNRDVYHVIESLADIEAMLSESPLT